MTDDNVFTLLNGQNKTKKPTFEEFVEIWFEIGKDMIAMREGLMKAGFTKPEANVMIREWLLEIHKASLHRGGAYDKP